MLIYLNLQMSREFLGAFWLFGFLAFRVVERWRGREQGELMGGSGEREREREESRRLGRVCK